MRSRRMSHFEGVDVVGVVSRRGRDGWYDEVRLR